MAYQRGRTDYEAIRDEASDPNTPPVEVSEEEYYDMLGCVPPLYVQGGFLVGEPITGDIRGVVHAHYGDRDGGYYARYAVAGNEATYLQAVIPIPSDRVIMSGDLV